MLDRIISLPCIACATFFSCFSIDHLHAADKVPQDALDHALVILTRTARAGDSTSLARQNALSAFEAADLDGGGVNASDDELRSAIAAAQARTREITRLFLHDLDGDGALTVDELRRSLLPTARKPLRSSAGQFPPTPEQVATTLNKLVADMKLSERDANGDGRVTIEEVLAAAYTEPVTRIPSRFTIDSAFDLDADGTITREEFNAVLDAAIAMIDSDSDQIISETEVTEMHRSLSDARARERSRNFREMKQKQLQARLEACPIPEVPESAEIVFLGLDRAPHISNVTFGAGDKVTLLTDVIVEPGERPIYLLTTSRNPMILRFSGAVQRLAQVVNLGRIPMGYVGVDRARASWFKEDMCTIAGWYPRMADGGMKKDASYIEALTGRPIDRVVGVPAAWMVALPGGELTTKSPVPEPWERREGLSGPVWKGVPDDQPDIFDRIDVAAVVAPEPVKPYNMYSDTPAILVPAPFQSGASRP